MQEIRRRGLPGPRFLLLVGLFVAASPARAGIFGVPTNLATTGVLCTGPGTSVVGADASCRGASADPPGWFTLEDTRDVSAAGDTVHQIRFFIEVTGTTLDIKIFDAGGALGGNSNGARDSQVDAGNITTDPTTTYALYNPSGVLIGGGPRGIIFDTPALTEDRLARLSCNNAGAPTFTLPNAGQAFGAGAGNCAALQPGLYELRVTAGTIVCAAGQVCRLVNVFGVQVTNAAGANYNVFTITRSDDNIGVPSTFESSMLMGSLNGTSGGANPGSISPPVTVYSYVQRGCSSALNNFDADRTNTNGDGGSAVVTDALGVAWTAIPMSGNDEQLSLPAVVEVTSTSNYKIDNYGMYRLEHIVDESNPAFNFVDWRFADWQGFTAATPYNLPAHAAGTGDGSLADGHIRMYLPSGYSACGASGCTMAPPVEPILTQTAVSVGGTNPPQGGQPSTVLLSASIYNPTATALTSAVITLPFDPTPGTSGLGAASVVGGTEACLLDGVATTCTFSARTLSGGYNYGRATHTAVGGIPAGSTLTYQYQILFTPTVNEVFPITAPPTVTSTLDRTTNAQFVPAWSSGAFPHTENLGPLCQISAESRQRVDLSLTKTDAPDPVTLGNNVTYTVTVSNSAVAAATNAVMDDPLPAGTTFVSLAQGGATTGWTCATPAVGSGGTITCKRPTFPVSTSTVFTIVVKTVSPSNPFTNTATVTSDDVDTNGANNSASASTAITAGADLAVTKVGSPSVQQAGSNVTFLVQVTNNGPSSAATPTLADTIVAPFQFQSITPPATWTCPTVPPLNGAGAINCTRSVGGAMAAGVTESFTVVVRITAGTAAGTVINNTSTVSTATIDPVPGNNSATDSTSVIVAGACLAPVAAGLTTGVVNDYWPATASAAAGSTSITLGGRLAGGAGNTIAVGNLLLVIQMQDGTFNSSNTDGYGDGVAGDMPSLASPGQLAGPTVASGSLSTGSVGRYEYIRAASAVGAGGGVLTLAEPLINSYTTAAPAFNAAGSNGQKSYQVIRVPVYNNLTLTGDVRPIAWVGGSATTSGGGVVVIEATGTLALGNNDIHADALGFRGGLGDGSATNDNAGATAHIFRNNNGGAAGDNEGLKGEGIHGSPNTTIAAGGTVNAAGTTGNGSGYPGAAANDGNAGLGAPGNAGGGGSFDTAGGGGANGGEGGRGGDEACGAAGCQAGDGSNVIHPVGHTGGRGGRLDFVPSPNRLVMGGGGGGGADGGDADGHGGVGGGIVLVRANAITVGNGQIRANGGNGRPGGADAGNAGGGGAGGSVLVTENGAGTIPAMTIMANGGVGGSVNGGTNANKAPGGGGGGGVIFLSTGSLATTQIIGGANGVRDNAGAAGGNPTGPLNATAGDNGFVGTIASPETPAQISACDPVVDVTVAISGPSTVQPGGTAAYTIQATNNGPVAAPNATVEFEIPVNMTFASVTPPAGWSCTTPPLGSMGKVRCIRATDMAAGVTESFTLITAVDAAAAIGSSIPAVVRVSTTGTENNYTNNEATTTAVGSGAPPSLVTRASIRGFAADPAAGRIEFATGSQLRTRAFNFYATDDLTGRTGRVRLNAVPLVTPAPNSAAPILYTAGVTPFTQAFVVIEEEELGGRTRALGPFAVGDPVNADTLARVRQRLTRAGARTVALEGGEASLLPSHDSGRLARLSQTASRRETLRVQHRERRARRGFAIEGLSLRVDAAGEVSVSLADLRSEGLPAQVRTRDLLLTNLGRAVPFTVRNPGAADEALVFEAQALATTYTARNPYILTWTRRPAAPVAPLSIEGAPPAPGFERIEKNYIYGGEIPQGSNPWVWDLLMAGDPWPSSFDPAAGDFDLIGLNPPIVGLVPVKMTFIGRSPHLHNLSVTINGQPAGSLVFEGDGKAELSGEVPASALMATGNKLAIAYTSSSADPSDPGLVYLDSLDLGVTRTRAPRVLTPGDIEPFSTSLPPAGRTDYLIVSHPDFLEQAGRIAELKRAEGHRVTVANAERAYDAFTAGVFDASAIAALVRSYGLNGRLNSVLIIGDDTIDYHSYYGLTPFPVVPSLYGWDGDLGRVPSENRTADLDGDLEPDVAIGRLPVQTDAEADAVVAKIQRQQSAIAANADRHLLVVDNQTIGDPSFRKAADTTASGLPRNTEKAFADGSLGPALARQTLFGGLGDGASFVHYFGHGGPQIWADEELLGADDIPSLAGTPEMVAFMWACQSQYYPYFYGPSLGEALLLLPQGGSVASFGPAGITDFRAQELFYRVLYSELLDPKVSFGEAIRRAKARSVADHPELRPVIEGFNLLGDPTIRLGGLKPR